MERTEDKKVCARLSFNDLPMELLTMVLLDWTPETHLRIIYACVCRFWRYEVILPAPKIKSPLAFVKVLTDDGYPNLVDWAVDFGFINISKTLQTGKLQ